MRQSNLYTWYSQGGRAAGRKCLTSAGVAVGLAVGEKAHVEELALSVVVALAPAGRVVEAAAVLLTHAHLQDARAHASLVDVTPAYATCHIIINMLSH